ncbi:MAG: hypothetical protein QW594_01485, partial [Candidatus Woesearchaeota archaeon]
MHPKKQNHDGSSFLRQKKTGDTTMKRMTLGFLFFNAIVLTATLLLRTFFNYGKETLLVKGLYTLLLLGAVLLFLSMIKKRSWAAVEAYHFLLFVLLVAASGA